MTDTQTQDTPTNEPKKSKATSKWKRGKIDLPDDHGKMQRHGANCCGHMAVLDDGRIAEVVDDGERVVIWPNAPDVEGNRRVVERWLGLDS